MDLTDPTRALTPTLDGPILAVLARSGRPLTVGEIATQAARGSEIGIRRGVHRLVEQGVVIATQMGRNQVHELNREHVAAPAAEVLAGLRLELWKRLRSTLAGWNPKPLYSCVFGSAARGDGGTDSDIDVLLVHQPFPGDKPSQSERDGLLGVFDQAVVMATPRLTSKQVGTWQSQVDDLHSKVRRWTGNRLQVVDISIWRWTNAGTTEPELFAEMRRDAISLVGQPVMAAALKER